MDEEDFHKQDTLPEDNPLEATAQAPSEEIPASIGPYKIESLLERGGMSLLYLGTHPETKEPVTVKVLSPRFLPLPEVVDHFMREASIIGLVDHPNIVKMHGHGKWEGGLYIAMEFIQGISLRQYILQTPVSLKRALEIVLDIAYAICHLHAHGVIHRDLKPENVIISEMGAVKVIDFGIAQVLTEKDDSDPEKKKRTLGTPIYMSPEQKDNPSDVSYPTDIYSLGIIAYELILGKLSHGHIHISLMPKGLQKIFQKSLQAKPEERYHDIVDLISDISAYLDSPAIQKDKKVGDQLSELSENMRSSQNLLLPIVAPQWQNLEISLATLRGLELCGIYYDFLEVREGVYGLIMGESSARGAEGIIYTSVLRGMVRAISGQGYSSLEFITRLNSLLSQDLMDQVFTLSYIELSPVQDKISVIPCRFGNIWHLPASKTPPRKLTGENMALGIDPTNEFIEEQLYWAHGDTLFVTSTTRAENGPGALLPDHIFAQALLDAQQLSTPKKVEYMMRKVKLTTIQLPTFPLFMVAIKRL